MNVHIVQWRENGNSNAGRQTKFFLLGNFFSTETFLKCPFFVGFLVSFCWLSFCRKMEVHDPKELLEVIIANESARDLLQSFISETVRPEVSV